MKHVKYNRVNNRWFFIKYKIISKDSSYKIGFCSTIPRMTSRRIGIGLPKVCSDDALSSLPLSSLLRYPWNKYSAYSADPDKLNVETSLI